MSDPVLPISSNFGRSIAEAWAKGYREQRLKTPHTLICNGKTGDWEGIDCPAGPYCECWCHL